ncbi:MAG: GNAT family N-acetyltransferase [Chloroflexota bacterium]|nr:MAG: GNAT family N-acetyltransferase [Chloroflexota bacterium]
MARHIVPLPLERAAAIAARSARFDRDTLHRHLVSAPHLSFVAQDTDDYVVVAPWRNRRQVAVIRELRGAVAGAELLDTVAASALREGFDLVVAEAANGSSEEATYRALGFETIDEICEYAVDDPVVLSPTIAVTRWPSDRAVELVDLDNRAFPWLWWNVVSEMGAYADGPGVEFWVAANANSPPAGYVSLTSRGHTGYIDRLAVDRGKRRRGIGAALVSRAVARLVQQGARRIALTTQYDNEPAQALYTRLGFRPTTFRLVILGRWLTDRRDRIVR